MPIRVTKTTTKWQSQVPARIRSIWSSCRGCEKCRMVQPPWKTVRPILIKWSIQLPFWPASPLLGMYLNEMKTYIPTKTCTQMFMRTLFIIGKNWKQPKCPSLSSCVWSRDGPSCAERSCGGRCCGPPWKLQPWPLCNLNRALLWSQRNPGCFGILFAESDRSLVFLHVFMSFFLMYHLLLSFSLWACSVFPFFLLTAPNDSLKKRNVRITIFTTYFRLILCSSCFSNLFAVTEKQIEV